MTTGDQLTAPAAVSAPVARSGVMDALRAIGLFILFVLIGYAFNRAVVVPSKLLLGIPLSQVLPGAWPEWAGFFGMAMGTLVMARWVDRMPATELFLDRDAARPSVIAVGSVIGAAAIAVPSLLISFTGWLRWTPAPDGSWWGAALGAALVLVPAAATEELVMRGYPFQLVRRRWGAGWALGITSVIFGAMHAGNPNARVVDIVVVTLAGLFLGLVMLRFRSLYAAWVAHFAWNFAMAALLHTPVSGLPLPTPDYRLVDDGPDWATGGTWGPESGAGAVVGMLVVIGYLVARHRRAASTRVSS